MVVCWNEKKELVSSDYERFFLGQLLYASIGADEEIFPSLEYNKSPVWCTFADERSNPSSESPNLMCCLSFTAHTDKDRSARSQRTTQD